MEFEGKTVRFLGRSDYGTGLLILGQGEEIANGSGIPQDSSFEFYVGRQSGFRLCQAEYASRQGCAVGLNFKGVRILDEEHGYPYKGYVLAYIASDRAWYFGTEKDVIEWSRFIETVVVRKIDDYSIARQDDDKLSVEPV